MYRFKSNHILIVILIVLGVGIYATNLFNPLFWDDDDWIVNNQFVHQLTADNVENIFSTNILAGFGLNSNYYRPVLLLSFMSNYVIHGIHPLGYHLVNNGLHIANGVLLFLLLMFLTGRRKIWAFSAALLFLIHPAQTEAVTYISGRGDPMSVFFMLSALILFIKMQKEPDKHNPWLMGSSLALFIAAIFSRETAVLFPALAIITYAAFIDRGALINSIGHGIAKTAPYIFVSMLYFALRMTALNFDNTLNFYGGSNEYTRHLSYRMYTFAHALVEYAKIFTVPVHLHMERVLPVHTSLFQWPVWLGIIGFICIFFPGIYWYKNGWRDQAVSDHVDEMSAVDAHNTIHLSLITSSRVWFFGWAWFFIALAPSSGIIPINALIYEHWLYLPMAGLAVMIGYGIDKLAALMSGHRRLAQTALTALVLYFTFFAIASAYRNMQWGKPVAFYEDILKYNPDSIRILNNLGNLYSSAGQLDKAIDVYQRAIRAPGGDAFAQPYYNLGNIYRDKGEAQEAIKSYAQAINTDPGFPFAYPNLSALLVQEKNYPGAIQVMEAFKKVQPQNARIYYNLIVLYSFIGNAAAARENYQQGLNYIQNDSSAAALFDRLIRKNQ